MVQNVTQNVSWFYFAFSLSIIQCFVGENGCYFIVFYFNFVKIKKKLYIYDLGLTFSDLLL